MGLFPFFFSFFLKGQTGINKKKKSFQESHKWIRSCHVQPGVPAKFNPSKMGTKPRRSSQRNGMEQRDPGSTRNKQNVTPKTSWDKAPKAGTKLGLKMFLFQVFSYFHSFWCSLRNQNIRVGKSSWKSQTQLGQGAGRDGMS